MSIFLRRLLAVWCLCISLGLIIRLSLGVILPDIGKISLILIAISVMVIGSLILLPLYKFPPGVLINPPWVAKFYDLIAVLFGGAAAIIVVDIILVTCLGIQTTLDDEYLRFMSVYFLLIGIPILAAFTSRLAHQVIRVVKNGIHIETSTSELIEWNDIKSIQLIDEFVLVGRVGLLIPSKLQKRLCITTQNGQQHYLNEPQTASKKKEVIDQIIVNMPEPLREDSLSILQNW